MGTWKNRRNSLRAPLYIDCQLSVGLRHGGAFIKVNELAGIKERVTVRFLLSSNSKPMQFKGQVVWSRSYLRHRPKFEVVNVMSVKFVTVREKCKLLIKNYILEAIHMDAQVRSHEISLVMGKICKLPPADRLKA